MKNDKVSFSVAYKPKRAVMAKMRINVINTMACIDSDTGPCILNSAQVDEVKFERVKWIGLPVEFFNEIKCPTEA